jgi:hypothetical protein
VNWQKPAVDDVDDEISRLAMLCGIALLQPGIVEAVFRNDERVCLVCQWRAWNRLRQLLVQHYWPAPGGIGSDSSMLHDQALHQRAESVRNRLQTRYLVRSPRSFARQQACPTSASAIS